MKNSQWKLRPIVGFMLKVGLGLSLSSIAAAQGLEVTPQNMDADLILQTMPSQQRSARAMGHGEKAQKVRATIRFHGNPLPQLKKMGVQIGSVNGPIATAEIPVSLLKEVTQVNGVEFVEAAKEIPLRLSKGVPATGATKIRSGSPMRWKGATGQGVIVGVVDTGVDFHHKDFQRTDGTTRLLSLWDQRPQARGQSPSGFSYGAECSASAINSAIRGNSSACQQPTGMRYDHGTHVAGIAAGNGQATGNGQSAFRYVGMAPQADIIAVNPLGPGVQQSVNSNVVLDAVNYVKQRAQALGKPAVINLSLGSYSGSRDGTSNYETALSNATGPGLIIVGAAGNEGNAPIRAAAPLRQGGTVSFTYEIPRGFNFARTEMWYPGNNHWSVKATSQDGRCSTNWVPAGRSLNENTSCGRVQVVNSGVNRLNGDRQMLAVFSNSGGTTWKISVHSEHGNGTASIIGAQSSGGPRFLNVPNVTNEILTDTCSATKVICVAAYVTRHYWENINGRTVGSTGIGPINDLATFSSRGPRRMCSIPSKCPQVAKPEITAPGAWIVAAATTDRHSGGSLEADGNHVAKSGTSMATPHVAGAVALLLQKSPRLTPAQVRSVLFKNVQRSRYTPSLPAYNPNVLVPSNFNYSWGYGILDIAKAWKALGGQPDNGDNNPPDDDGDTPPDDDNTPPVVTSPEFSAVASGNSNDRTVVATIRPSSVDLGKNVNVYVLALMPDRTLYASNRGRWQRADNGRFPYYARVKATKVMRLKAFNHQNTTGLEGLSLIVGYGTNLNEMLKARRYKAVYTVQ